MGTNEGRQMAFEAIMRQAGIKQIALWVDTIQGTTIIAFLMGVRTFQVTSAPSHSIRLPASRGFRKKRDA